MLARSVFTVSIAVSSAVIAVSALATEVIDVGHFLPMAFADWFSRKEMRPSSSAQSVLLVDDSAFFRNMLAPVLKAAGYKVRTAPNAQEGLAALRSGQSFDVVLTDIEMPDMNGFECYTKLKDINPRLPIILLTGYGYDPTHSLVKARQQGLQGVLYKPFKLDQLLEEVEKAVSP